MGLHCKIITSSGVPPEVPIPLRTASKVCPCPHFINHTILSVKLLHASRSKHTSLAASKPISLSAHALPLSLSLLSSPLSFFLPPRIDIQLCTFRSTSVT